MGAILQTEGFWGSLAGVLTALAALLTAAGALVAALARAGVLRRRRDPPPPPPAVPLEGSWRARVHYPWGAVHQETFRFRREGARLLGTATFLGHPRAVEQGAVSEDRVRFVTRVEELAGGGTRSFENHYDGLVSPRGILFTLQDTRGTLPVEFTARRPADTAH